MKKKNFKPGQLVSINLRTKKLESVILSKDFKKEGFYFLDWTVCGYNQILNTVSITSEVLSRRMEKFKNDDCSEQAIEL